MRTYSQNRISILLRRALCLLLALLITCGFALPEIHARAASDGMMRVKLTRLGTPSTLKFTTSCAYAITSGQGMNIPSGSTVTVTASDGKLSVTAGGETLSFGSSVKIYRCKAGNVGVTFTSPSLSNVFCGDLFLSASGSAITVILNIYIQNYLYGVVGYEMSNSWPLEALKAQAVAARNYALRNKSSSGSYDVTDNTSDQVFKGYNSSSARVIQAVNETDGLVLYYGSSLASCYYSASNGGQTEATSNIWGGKLGYSVVKDDPYDLENTSAKKKSASFNKDASALNASLQSALIAGVQEYIPDHTGVTLKAIAAVKGVNPKYAAPSILYKDLRFTVTASSQNTSGKTVTGDYTVDVPTYGSIESWYSLSINSGSNETVIVTESSSAFTVTFRRYGHGAGMSQRGAQTMASAYGMKATEILDFYYPGTTQKVLTLSDTTADHSAPAATATPTPTPKPTPTIYVDPAIEPTLKPNADIREIPPFEGLVQPSFDPDEATPTPAPTATPTPKPTPTPAPTATPLPSYGMSFVDGTMMAYVNVSASGSLNLREAPNTSSAIILQMERNTPLYVLAYNSSWAWVRTLFGTTGYASMSYLRFAE